MVVDVLDPEKTRIQRPPYSARDEYQYLSSTLEPRLSQKEEKLFLSKRPPKDTRSLYPFCEFPGEIVIEPLIVDDMVHTWNQDQRDSVIVCF